MTLIITFYCRHYIPARAGARKVRAKGIFPKAKVVRGIDWEYGNEDGMMHSYILSIFIQPWCMLQYQPTIWANMPAMILYTGGDGSLGTVVILKNWKPGSYVSFTYYVEIV